MYITLMAIVTSPYSLSITFGRLSSVLSTAISGVFHQFGPRILCMYNVFFLRLVTSFLFFLIEFSFSVPVVAKVTLSFASVSLV